jgi:molecular chaperone GrpE
MPLDNCEADANKDPGEKAAQNQAENAPLEAKDQGAEPIPQGETAASPADADSADDGPAVAEPEDLAAQLAETRDQLLRKAADFENFRKRMNQEKQMAIEYANQSLLLDIIPIIDDFERALQAAESSKDFAALLEGITMIEKRLTGQLESKWGLKRFNSAGELFDPNRHEALMMEKSPEVSEPTVQEDLLKGYLLKDRVIRAAKVKVLMPGGRG